MRLTLRFLLTMGLAVACVWAQRGGGGTSGGTTSGGTSGGTGGTAPGGTGGGTTGGTGTPSGPSPGVPGTNNPTIGTQPAQPNTTTQAPPQQIYLSGRVAMDDGSPLPGSVNIQAVCGSTRRIVDHTSANGNFGFRWSYTSGAIFEDASENGLLPGYTSGGLGSNSQPARTSISSGGFPGNPLADCELRVDLAGYTSSRVSLFNHRELDDPDVGTISLHRIAGDEGRVVSALSLKAPKDAKKSFDKGQEQIRSHKIAEAAASFQKAVDAYSQYADAWLELGKARLQLGAKDDASAAFEKAMALDNKLVGPWQQLGYLASDRSDWPAATKFLDQAVRLDPMDSAMAWYFDAMANFNQGKYDVAERSIRAEMKLDTGQNPRAEYLFGLVLIARKDIAGGMTVLRKFVDTYPDDQAAASAKKVLANVENALASAHQ